MATIKGITIEFNGDTSKLSRAINQVRNEAKGFDKELKYIDNSLKFNPKNVDLLKQKIAVLKDTTKASEKNIKDMKDALNEMKSKGIDETNADYRELQREIIKAESKQKDYNKELKKLEASASPLGQASAKMSALGEASTKAGESLRGLSMVAGAVDVALAGLTVKAGATADDLNTMAKVTGISTQELQKYKLSADLLDVSVETIAKSQTKMKKSMLSAQQGSKNVAEAFDTLGVSIVDSNGHLRDQDSVFEETIKALGKMENETERDALSMQIFGKSANELNPLIEDNGETFQKVADIFAKNNLDVVDQETIDKANQFNDALDTIKLTGMATLSTVGMQLAGYLAPAMEKVADIVGKIMGWLSQLDPAVLTVIGIIAGVIAVLSPLLIMVGKVAMGISSIMTLASTLGVTLGASLLPTIGIVVGAIAGLIAIGVFLYKHWDDIKYYAGVLKDWVVEKWTALKDGVVNTVMNLVDKVKYYWEALKLGLTIIITAIKTTISDTWESIKSAVTNVVNTISTTVSNVFNGLKNTVTSIFNGIKSTAISVWNGIKDAIQNPINTAVTFVKNAIDKIKGFFSGLKLELPHIKLPHFKLSGSFSLAPPSVPKLSIDWYKDGAIFNRPAIFPNGVGIGDVAGGEAVLPLKKFWEEMDSRSMGTNITINVNASPGMDINELVKEIERKLITNTKRQNYAWR